jgi:hypothetical protein
LAKYRRAQGITRARLRVAGYGCRHWCTIFPGRCGALDAAEHRHRDETIERLAKHVTTPAGWRLPNPAIS